MNAKTLGEQQAFACTTSVSERADWQAHRQQQGLGPLGNPPMITTIRTSGGLTKREAFAMAAMQGILSGKPTDWIELNHEKIARKAVCQADELLSLLARCP